MSAAVVEPRPIPPAQPLPVCPRPFPGEASGSWLWRVAREYGYSTARFMDAIGLDVSHPRTAGQTLRATEVQHLAYLARLPIEALAYMAAIPVEWRLVPLRDKPLCCQCWREDDRLFGQPVEYNAWLHAGRISCRRHGTWLTSTRETVGPGFVDPDDRARNGIPEQTLDQMIASDARRRRYPPSSMLTCVEPILVSVEATVVRATGGLPPDEDDWGGLDADGFLQVVDDVTTWSLTSFEIFRAPCPADVFVAKSAPVLPSIFRPWAAPAPPWTAASTVVHLRDRIDPAARRSALWLAHALLANAHPAIRTTDGRTDRQARQRQVFRGQNPAGLAWLAAQMQQWPDVYRARNWVDVESLLVPPGQ